MPTVLLAGAFGQGNPGDEALLRAFLDHLDGWRSVVTSSDPSSTERQYGCRAVASNDLIQVARVVGRSDALVFAGGTVFKTLHPSSRRAPSDSLRKGLALATGARLLRKPVAMLGVGAGELSGMSKHLARSLARRPHLLVLRDEESAMVLQSCGVRPPFRVGTDPAWTLFGTPPDRSPHTDDVIVVLSHLAGDASLGSYVANAIRPLVAEGVRLRLQPWQQGRSGGDERLAQDISRDTGADVIPPPGNIVDAAAIFRTCSLVVGLRYHALLAAAAAGVTFLAYTHEPKLAGIARRLRQPAVAPALPSERFADAVRAALSAPAPVREAVGQQIETAEAGFRLLRLLLDGGKTAEPEEVVGLPLRPAPGAA